MNTRGGKKEKGEPPWTCPFADIATIVIAARVTYTVCTTYVTNVEGIKITKCQL